MFESGSSRRRPAIGTRDRGRCAVPALASGTRIHNASQCGNAQSRVTSEGRDLTGEETPSTPLLRAPDLLSACRRFRPVPTPSTVPTSKSLDPRGKPARSCARPWDGAGIFAYAKQSFFVLARCWSFNLCVYCDSLQRNIVRRSEPEIFLRVLRGFSSRTLRLQAFAVFVSASKNATRTTGNQPNSRGADTRARRGACHPPSSRRQNC